MREVPSVSPEDLHRLSTFGIPLDPRDPNYALADLMRLPLGMFRFPVHEIPELVGVASSSVPCELAWEALRLPQDVSGIQVLDAGGGGSDMTVEFLERGADAYAIDPQYDGDVAIQEMCLHISGVNQIVEMSVKERQARRKALTRFINSYNQSPERYVQASMTRIPFPNNHFDMVYSIRAAIPYLDRELEVFRATMQELLRVGKEVRLLPYMGKDPGRPVLDDRRLRNQETAYEELKADPNLQLEVYDATTNLGQLLVITRR